MSKLSGSQKKLETIIQYNILSSSVREIMSCYSKRKKIHLFLENSGMNIDYIAFHKWNFACSLLFDEMWLIFPSSNLTVYGMHFYILLAQLCLAFIATILICSRFTHYPVNCLQGFYLVILFAKIISQVCRSPFSHFSYKKMCISCIGGETNLLPKIRQYFPSHILKFFLKTPSSKAAM